MFARESPVLRFALLLVCSLWCVKAQDPCLPCLYIAVTDRVGAAVTIDQCTALAKLVTDGWGADANKATGLSLKWACISGGFTATATAPTFKICVTTTTEAGAAKLMDYYTKTNNPSTALAGYLYTATGDAGLHRQVYLTNGCTTPVTSPTTKQDGPPLNVPCTLCLTAIASDIVADAPATKAQCDAFAKSLVGSSGPVDVLGPDPKLGSLTFTCQAVNAAKSDVANLKSCASGVPYSAAQQRLTAYQANLAASSDALSKLLAAAVPDGGTQQTFTLDYSCFKGSVNIGTSAEVQEKVVRNTAGCVPSVCDCEDQDSCLALVGQPIASVISRRSLLAADGVGTVQCCEWGYSGCSNSGVPCAKLQATNPTTDDTEVCKLCVVSSATGRVGTAITKAQCDTLATSYSKDWAAKLVTGFDASKPFTCASDSIKGTATDPQVVLCADQPFKNSDAVVSKYASSYASTDVGDLAPLWTKAITNGGKTRTFIVQYTCPSTRSRRMTSKTG